MTLRPKSLVSIVLPTYNSMQYIGETISSVLEQSYSDWELIIVDDGSSDGTWELVKDFSLTDKRIMPIRLPANSGSPVVPRNIGIEKASGDYIALVDSDDVWHSEKLECQLTIMESNKLDFCCTCVERFSGELASEEAAVHSEKVVLEEISFVQLLSVNKIPLSTVMARKSVFENQNFSGDPRHHRVEDYELWLRIHQAEIASSKILLPLVFYRVRRDSFSGNKWSVAIKRLALLREVEVKGEGLGFMAYVYFFNYLKDALFKRI